ncbi:crystal protein [Betta splendens]|uniref:Carboxylic ester hydrolase n=1 Tax=Betta splendens TaxID=158456 RepID=A0A6P7NPR5_BETSP|nr:crystal protein [Betta splendens]
MLEQAGGFLDCWFEPGAAIAPGRGTRFKSHYELKRRKKISKRAMGSWWCLLLLCPLTLVPTLGEEMNVSEDPDLFSFLRSLFFGLPVRDEQFVTSLGFDVNSLKDLRHPESLDHSITQQAKNKAVGRDTNKARGPVLSTKKGQLKGITVEKAHIFHGVPYADPPVGELRWKPPRPVSSWLGVYDATYPKAACMQSCSGPISGECPWRVSEDCLYLNIFVPLDVDFGSLMQMPLPVMVWIHGGNFITGSASKPLYDGRSISNFTHTIVVGIEYRLGAFGFLELGDDPRTSPVGNYGILDQQAALFWVQQNIAVFGGDPSKVTIFGESAGAQSVGLHLIIQSSGPLFSQAILQSSPFSIPMKSRHDAMKLGKDFVKQTNCSRSDIPCLLSLAPQAVLVAQMKTSSRIMNPFRFLEAFETWGPYIDGELIKEQAPSAFQRGAWQREKPVLLGTTSEEGVIFIYAIFHEPVSTVESTLYITAIFKQHALQIIHEYLPQYMDADRRDMLAQIITDYVFVCPARRTARANVPTGSNFWQYMFDHVVTDPRLWSGLTFCYKRACHGAELPFVFGSAAEVNLTMSLPEKLMSNRMLCYWGAFAHAGDPSSRAQQTTFCHAQHLPIWPRYAEASGWLLMNLTVGSHAQVAARNHICDFWDQLDIY